MRRLILPYSATVTGPYTRCDWGTKLSWDTDRTVCLGQAVKQVKVSERDIVQTVAVCGRHFELVHALTVPVKT